MKSIPPFADWRDHITTDEGVLTGKPIIKGTRISVELVLDNFASGWDFRDVLEAYPHLTRNQVQAALSFAAEVITEARPAGIRKAMR